MHYALLLLTSLFAFRVTLCFTRTEIRCLGFPLRSQLPFASLRYCSLRCSLFGLRFASPVRKSAVLDFLCAHNCRALRFAITHFVVRFSGYAFLHPYGNPLKEKYCRKNIVDYTYCNKRPYYCFCCRKTYAFGTAVCQISAGAAYYSNCCTKTS